MIQPDEIESKSRVASCCQPGSDNFVLVAVFQADEDLTLRQVHFLADPVVGGEKSMVLTTDPSFTRPEATKFSQEFQLRARSVQPTVGSGQVESTSYTQLAFPVPKGTKLYWGIDGTASPQSQMVLVFS